MIGIVFVLVGLGSFKDGEEGRKRGTWIAVLQFTEYYTVYQGVPPISSPGFLIGHIPRLSGVLLVISFIFPCHRLGTLGWCLFFMIPYWFHASIFISLPSCAWIGVRLGRPQLDHGTWYMVEIESMLRLKLLRWLQLRPIISFAISKNILLISLWLCSSARHASFLLIIVYSAPPIFAWRLWHAASEELGSGTPVTGLARIVQMFFTIGNSSKFAWMGCTFGIMKILARIRQSFQVQLRVWHITWT